MKRNKKEECLNINLAKLLYYNLKSYCFRAYYVKFQKFVFCNVQCNDFVQTKNIKLYTTKERFIQPRKAITYKFDFKLKR